ncbi:hypothetical protein RxyAA322_18140 [Rubrobacter xylanophilus]|uniref:Uncharacterized protein n=1 Tax=Rubrobacter xylanophilus TaxID=49319 RepID=A0A510HJ02_9ACTN|nr:hypothetical protein [Rubrobacter xylanophilus]BBL79960.1 hypothetical protein RxyAA322_18140 [Rubrobacter xylanophilus]
MTKKLITDEPWEAIEPLLQQEPPTEEQRTRETLAQEMGCGSGMTG